MEKEFNLLDEEWIPVIYSNGDFRYVSLRKAFEDAHRVHSISGDVPPQDAVLIRLMLAVLHCIYSRCDADGNDSPIVDEQDAMDRWSSLWNMKKFDMDVVDAYLSSYEDRFFLFHPKWPFFQVNIDKGTEYTAAKLNGALSESSNKPRLFSNVSGSSKTCLSYPEAARWLLYVNAFDDTSAKPSVKGQDMPSPGAGWLGKLGLVMVLGDNLFETLMLNFVLVGNDGSPFPDGKAVWELDDVRTDERVNIPLPESPQELLTLQDRRLLLKRNSDIVTGYLLLGGDIVPKENALTEQMTMWSLTKDNTWVPKRHDPARAMWRDFSSIMMRSGELQKGILEPGVVRWVSTLIDEGIIEMKKLNVRATGIKYADKDFFVEDLIDDSLTVNSSVLSEMNEAVNDRIDRTVVKTDECVRILGCLASDIAMLNGLDKDGAKKEAEKARTQGYIQLDQPFRSWIASVDPDSKDIESQFNLWDSFMERILIEEGRTIIDEAGSRALIGKIDEKGNLQNGFTAFRIFKIRLHRKIRGD